MKNEIFINSDCCGVEMTVECADYGICPRCGEHCDAVVEIMPIPE